MRMAHKYKPKPGVKTRNKYPKKEIMKAVDAVNKGMPFRAAEKKYGIPKYIIYRHKKVPTTLKPRHPTSHGEEVEKMLVKHVVTCSKLLGPVSVGQRVSG